MEVLSTRKTSAKTEEIIDTAEKDIIIVSPYLKMSKTIQERVISKISQGVKVNFLFGKVENDFSDYKEIRDNANVSIFYLDALHAKLYGNENSYILTSMNLHSFSETNNWELGIEVDTNNEAYIELEKELKMMFRASVTKFGTTKILIDNDVDEIDEWIKELSNKYPFVKIDKNQKNTNDNTQSPIFVFRIDGIDLVKCKYYEGKIIVESPDSIILNKVFDYYSKAIFGSCMRVYNNSTGMYIYPKEGIALHKLEFSEKKEIWNVVIRDVIEMLKKKKS